MGEHHGWVLLISVIQFSKKIWLYRHIIASGVGKRRNERRESRGDRMKSQFSKISAKVAPGLSSSKTKKQESKEQTLKIKGIYRLQHSRKKEQLRGKKEAKSTTDEGLPAEGGSRSRTNLQR